MEHRPIFIIGCPRSGTSLLRLILDSHPNISCGPETHFLSEFEKIVGMYWRRVSRFGFDKSYWLQKSAEYFDSFQMDYARKRGKKRWAEKTPTYTLHLDFINSLFPNCQFIHIIRNGMDVVASHRDRWGYKSALSATKRWSRFVNSARDVGMTLPSDRYFEVRYETLVTEPESTLRGLLEFLEEPWHPECLRYNEAHHDMGDRHYAFTGARRGSGNGDSVIYSSRVGAGRKELDALLKTLIRRRGGALLKELGYA